MLTFLWRVPYIIETLYYHIPEMENWDINWDSAHILCIHLHYLAGTVICPITHTYSYTYIYTYWQEMSSAPLRIYAWLHNVS